MKQVSKIFFSLTLVLLSFTSTSLLAKNSDQPFTLTLAHFSDSHAHLQPTEMTLKIGGQKIVADVGGLPALTTKALELRSKEENFLFLNTGDVFVGTLFFNTFKGLADLWFMNYGKLDALVIGNHDLDRGSNDLAQFIQQATFPILAANIETGPTSPFDGKFKPFIIKEFGHQRVALIGLATPETPGAKDFHVKDPITAAKQTVDDLKKQEINKIIVLSHLGYLKDKELARAVPEIDVILGGHSHSFLGKLKRFGITTRGPYPTLSKGNDGNQTLIVHEGDDAKLLGYLTVTFDNEGRIMSSEGCPLLLIENNLRKTDKSGRQSPLDPRELREVQKVIAENPSLETVEPDTATKNQLDQFEKPLQTLEHTILTVATEDLKRNNNGGTGSVVADAFLTQTKNLGAQIALLNNTGARDDIKQGNVSVADAYTVLPLEDKLTLVKVTGQELKKTLEDSVGYQIDKKRQPPFLYVSGFTFGINAKNPRGQRIVDLALVNSGKTVPLQDNETYTLVTNSYVAGGGSGYKEFTKTVGGQRNTGIPDVKALIDYLKTKKTIANPTEVRIKNF